MKESWKPGTMINPLPAVLVTCGDTPEKWNMITVAWTGTTINLTTASMARATDWAGVRSGRDYDKWKETGLTPIPGEKVKSPTIEESPLSIECRVKRIERLGSHSMFIAEVLGVRADSRFIDKETGKFDLEKAGLIAYSHGAYHKLGPAIGKFGFSVQKRK